MMAMPPADVHADDRANPHDITFLHNIVAGLQGTMDHARAVLTSGDHPDVAAAASDILATHGAQLASLSRLQRQVGAAAASTSTSGSSGHGNSGQGQGGGPRGLELRAALTGAEINNLPDSAFAYIEPGGSKDAEGKTVPRSKRHFPIHDAAHVRNALARIAQGAEFGKQAMPKVMAAAKRFGVDTNMQMNSAGPLGEFRSALLAPDIDVIRTMSLYPELRSGGGGDSLGTLEIPFSPFNTWYEVNSKWEGRFMERTTPGTFADTITRDRGIMRSLFDHGHDPQIGNKVLGPIDDLREDAHSPVGVVDLLDTAYNRDLLPGLKARVYGSSFRMHVLADDWNNKPARSEHNPDGLPERTITKVKALEFGPVTFPANPAATATVRSGTDHFYDQLRTRDSSAYEAAVRAAGLPDLTVATSTGRVGGGAGTGPGNGRGPLSTSNARHAHAVARWKQRNVNV